MQLSQSLVVWDLCLLIRPGFGYENRTILRYELLLLLHHLLCLSSTFRKVDLCNLVHSLFRTRILSTAHLAESLLTGESGGGLMRSYLQLALELAITDSEIDHA